MNYKEKECHVNPIISSDGKVIITSNIIYYHIVEPFEAVYETENLEKTLEDVQIKTFREFCDKLDSSKIKNIDESMKLDFKNLLNNKITKYGCQIDNVEIKIWDDNALNNKFNEDLKRIDYIKKKIENSNFKTTNETSPNSFIETFVGCIVFFAVILIYAIIRYELRKRFELTFIFFRIILNNLVVFSCSIGIVWIVKLYTKQKIEKLFSIKNIKTSLILTIIYSILFIPVNHTNLLKYEIDVFRDIVENNTIKLDCEYVIGYQKRRNSRYYTFYSDTLSYDTEGNNSFYSSGVPPTIVPIVENKLRYLEKTIEIEYYKNSKIIKSIDGIELSDKNVEEKLEKRIEYLSELEMKEKKEEEEHEKAKQEQLKKEEEENKEIRIKEYSIQCNSIGKKIDEIKEELHDIGINDIDIKYINSRYYPIGTVAFVARDGENFTLKTFYVVGSNEGEDLTKMPRLQGGMSKNEIIQILEECELNYRFNSQKNDSSTKGLYLYTPPGEGVYVPKGSIVKVTINE